MFLFLPRLINLDPGGPHLLLLDSALLTRSGRGERAVATGDPDTSSSVICTATLAIYISMTESLARGTSGIIMRAVHLADEVGFDMILMT